MDSRKSVRTGCARVSLAIAIGLLATVSARGDGWKFAVVSDIHVYPTGRVAPAFDRLVRELVALRPRFVVIDGDSTNGNTDDTHGQATCMGWWRSLRKSLEPLREAGIPVLPVAGNHDYYREPHRQAYLDSWKDLAAEVGTLRLEGAPPRYYSVTVDGVYLALLHLVSHSVPAELRTWLTAQGPTAEKAALRLAFGHVPMFSVMGTTVASYERDLGALLSGMGFYALIAGHEHLVWDEIRTYSGKALRQITVGTASATYTFPLSAKTHRAHCDGETSVCTLPGSGLSFSLKPGTRQQELRQTFAMVEIRPGADGGLFPVIQALALDGDGKVIPFSRAAP